MIAYEDASAALKWLAKAFGFRERTRITMPDGSIGHAEMEIVDDVDAHFKQAEEWGATILSEPEDTDHGRSYRAADLEGHRWMFDQRLPAAAPAQE